MKKFFVEMEVGLMEVSLVRSVNRSWIYDTLFSLYRELFIQISALAGLEPRTWKSNGRELSHTPTLTTTHPWRVYMQNASARLSKELSGNRYLRYVRIYKFMEILCCRRADSVTGAVLRTWTSQHHQRHAHLTNNS